MRHFVRHDNITGDSQIEVAIPGGVGEARAVDDILGATLGSRCTVSMSQLAQSGNPNRPTAPRAGLIPGLGRRPDGTYSAGRT